MRSAISLAVVTFVIGSALPASPQQISPMADPIGRSIARESARFAAIPLSEPDDSEWLRIRRLAPGTELIVIGKGSQPARRYFLAVDDSDLTVLNAGETLLPSAVRKVLREIAATHPEYLLAAQRGGRFVLETYVRVGPDGVFVADQKIADLAQVVERYGRREITGITTAQVESNPVGCALAGYYGGGIVGGIPGAVIGGAVGRDTGPALLGMMVGWSIGAVDVYRKCRHKPEKTIYSEIHE